MGTGAAELRGAPQKSASVAPQHFRRSVQAGFLEGDFQDEIPKRDRLFIFVDEEWS